MHISVNRDSWLKTQTFDSIIHFYQNFHFFENTFQSDEKPIISKSVLNAGSKTLGIIKTDTNRYVKKNSIQKLVNRA